MPAEVTIVLDTGAFLTENTSEVRVGYFQTTGPNDIEVREDGNLKPGNIKLGQKVHVEVLHLKAGDSRNTRISFSPKFRGELLRKEEMYKAATPDFKEETFHCVLHFESGDFETTGVKKRWFKECDAASGVYTGKNHHTKLIAQDVLVTYKLADGEELKLLRDDNTVLWSSGKVGTGSPSEFEVTLLGDPTNNHLYFRDGLKLKGKTCWLPNPDPPPVGAP